MVLPGGHCGLMHKKQRVLQSDGCLVRYMAPLYHMTDTHFEEKQSHVVDSIYFILIQSRQEKSIRFPMSLSVLSLGPTTYTVGFEPSSGVCLTTTLGARLNAGVRQLLQSRLTR